MNDPAILFVKPKAISKADKAALKEAGVIVIECANPADMKFTRAHAELSGGGLLTAALKAISTSSYGNSSIQQFGKLVVEAYLDGTHHAVIDK